MSHPRTTRRAALFGLAAVLIASTVACGSPASTGPRNAPRTGGTVSVGFDNEPTTLDPAFSSQISSDRSVLNLFYDTLLRQNRDGGFVPALAEKWDAQPRALTFTLRTGVKFHDGTPFDAKAVAANINRVLDPATKSTKTSALAKIATVAVVDDRTVRFDLKDPDPLLLVQLAHEPGMMVSPEALKTKGAEFGRNPVGTGPFTFDQWRSKVQLTVVRNTSYWGKDADGNQLPRLDKVVVRFITEPKVLRTELATDGVQLVRALPPEEFAQLASDKQVSMEDVGVRRSYYVALNTTRAPFNDPKMRAAFTAAVDRSAIGKVAASDQFDLAPSFATKKDWYYDDSITSPSFDQGAAKAAVTAPTSITVLARRRAPDPTIAELLQAQLSDAGFTVKSEVLELQTQLDRMRKQDFDAAVLVVDVPRLDPSLVFDPYFTSKGSNNWSGLNDSTLDDVLLLARSTDDKAVRSKAYSDVQRRILDQRYWTFLHQAKSPLIHRTALKGVVLNVDGQWRLDEAYLDR
ncbi:ABC transporter substrate-binding protein [Lentzea cavernae]|uniref:Peptide ABC transporter substrate-binding protein n=1 Tax=Lentzea cavernae TaxID=2020703 RepID=A0ABQ3MH71_9PSEU|nr:ABC transporter substrate-binding protein [Lentzea cavernae]GHH43901.1 peptide ABC transporter substrate-binding protein [Lentzea cavernae]